MCLKASNEPGKYDLSESLTGWHPDQAAGVQSPLHSSKRPVVVVVEKRFNGCAVARLQCTATSPRKSSPGLADPVV